jgi:predicted  nucleic acid-binding Zn-ribbon protein
VIPLFAQAQAAAPGVTLPVWSLPVGVAVGLALLGFVWRLALRAEDTARRIESAASKLESLESRLAALTALEKSVALVEKELQHTRSELAGVADEVKTLRAAKHEQASKTLALEGRVSTIDSRVGHLDDEVRRSIHPPTR